MDDLSKIEIKEILLSAIDQYADDIISIGETILKNPELGYKEEKTSALVCSWFNRLNIPYSSHLAVTGVKGSLCESKNGINVCVIGEMDAVKSIEHPTADINTGAAHACGHNAQIAAMIGTAIAFSKSNVLKHLDGKITFFAVPAEEFVEIEYRQKLKKMGKIQHLGGKQQLISEGQFDDIDIAMMIHSQAKMPEEKLLLEGGSLGFMAKTIKFIGKEAHGSEPFDGVNALNAAMLALMGIHANRETFRDEDKIRIHPIVTKGGELVNIVPSEVTMETYVRGANINAIKDACDKVDRCIKGAAMSIGADVEIKNISGYLPLNQDKTLSKTVENNAREIIGEENILHGIDMVGSTDMGDLSHLIPCLHANMGGYDGAAHSKDFCVTNKKSVYIDTVKILSTTIVDLLYNKSELGKQIKSQFIPKSTKQEYLEFLKEDN